MYIFRVLFFSIFVLEASQLDYLIAPEIKDDTFYQMIYELAKTKNVKNILEIGSSSGEGSTEAFVKGISENPYHPLLFCMEISAVRFAALEAHYRNNPFVRCYRASSVPLSSFPTEEEVIDFLETAPTILKGTQEVLRWLRQDIEYIKNSGVFQEGIALIKKQNSIEYFDMVLIDGSEFTGKPELDLVYGAKYILLDDIFCYKNLDNYEKLCCDPNYRLFAQDTYLRGGWAAFVKIEAE